jgi:energy-converting hydrogenase Eha subunit C
MERYILIFILLLVSILLFSRYSGYFVSPTVSVSIEPKKEAKILLNYKPIIDITERENITAEVVNTGSVSIYEELMVRIHFYNRSLRPIAEYYDSPRNLLPGDRTAFFLVFVPNSTGTYFIQAKSTYDGKTTETWGRFDVIITPILQPVIMPPEKVPQYVPTPVFLAPPKLSIQIKNITDAYQDSFVLIPVTLINNGERDAYEIRPYLSYPKSLEVSISPLYIKQLSPGENVTFLLNIKIPKDFQVGVYQLFFEASSNETKASKEFYLNVSSKPIDLTPDIYEKILSVEYMLSQARIRMSVLEIKGIDVSKINSTLILAEIHLKKSKDYLSNKQFDESFQELNEASKLISDALIEMEILMIIAPKAYLNYFLIAIILIVILAIVLFIILYRRRKKKRPKLLRELESESQATE